MTVNFLERFAAALDQEQIVCRVGGNVVYVPIATDMELQFHLQEKAAAYNLCAANVYLDSTETDDDPVFVQVVFSVEDALAAVIEHIGTEQVISCLQELLEGVDDRLAQLDFYQDEEEPNQVAAPVGEDAELQVFIEHDADHLTPMAAVTLVTGSSEELTLGQFPLTEQLFDVLAYAASQAAAWEKMLLPLED